MRSTDKFLSMCSTYVVLIAFYFIDGSRSECLLTWREIGPDCLDGKVEGPYIFFAPGPSDFKFHSTLVKSPCNTKWSRWDCNKLLKGTPLIFFNNLIFASNHDISIFWVWAPVFGSTYDIWWFTVLCTKPQLVTMKHLYTVHSSEWISDILPRIHILLSVEVFLNRQSRRWK